MAEKNSTVLIYGTSIAGYRAAYTLAKMGYKSVLLNRGAYVDQIRNQVLAQLPLDFCWACGHMPQRLFIGLGALQVFYNADILGVSGEPGNFKVKIRKKDQFVNNLACTECEECVKVCPEGAIKVIPEIAWENIFYLDEEKCTKCLKCEEVCPTKCLKVERSEEELELEVGAIIFAPEFEEPSDDDLEKFATSHPNVVRNADLARRSLYTNFVKNSLARPSDGKVAKRVAVIVTPQYNYGREFETYNLSVLAVYRAYKIKQIMPDAEVVVFLRDYKGFAKGHYRWFEKALEAGVKVVRASEVSVEPEGDEPKVRYTFAGKEESFDAELVILLTGQKAPSVMDKLKGLVGVEADEHGFCRVKPLTAGETNVEGIYAVGEVTGPKGNPETVWEGYAVATEVRKHLGETNFAPPPPPPLRDVSAQEPKVGVFVCSCFGEFNKFLNLEELTDKVKGIPGVAHVEIIKGCCTPPTMKETAERIKASGVNRVVLAVCTPLQKLLKFRRTVMMAGLNPLLSEFLRLREDVIRVHTDKEKMMEKAFALIYGGVEKVKRAIALPPPVGKINNAVVVIGGGAAGLETARLLAEKGVEVHLVEKSSELGGLAKGLYKDLEGVNVREHVLSLIEEVKKLENVHIYLNSEVVEAEGTAGRFFLMIENREEGKSYVLQAGAIVLATGALEFKPHGAFLYGKNPNVLTQRELEKQINSGEFKGKSVVMIQCVGSRNKAHPYCSRVCCSHALKNAFALREAGVEVTILYRDLNLYGMKEDYRKMAEEKGIRFVRFDGERYPMVEEKDGALVVRVHDVEEGVEKSIETDTVALSVGIVPDKVTNEKLAKLLGYNLDADGFFESDASACPFEEAIKRLMKPFELQSKGIFPVGLAHSPRSYVESLLTAKDAAGKILTFIKKLQLPPPNAMYVSAVRESKCTGCAMCVTVCPYYARYIDEEKKIAKVVPYLCDSCGACLVACPSEAAYLRDARAEMMIPHIDALLV